MKLNRKWLMVIALVMSLTMATAGTLAYLTDRDTEVNTFTMGNVDIEVDEEYEPDSPLYPGVEVEKKAGIENVHNTSDAWVWMTVSVPTKLVNYIDLEWLEGTTVDTTTRTDVHEGYTSFVVKHPEVLKAGESTDKYLQGVTLSELVDYQDGSYGYVANGEFNKLEGLDDLKIIVDGFAMQTDGFDNVQAAYKAYEKQWEEMGNGGDSGANGGPEPDEPANGDDDSVTYEIPADATRVTSSDELADAIKNGYTSILLAEGEYNWGDTAKPGSNPLYELNLYGESKNAILYMTKEGGEGADYDFDGYDVTFTGLTISNDKYTSTGNYYPGWARMEATYNDCVIDGMYVLYDESEFNYCTLNVTGDTYNIWTWGAGKAAFDHCTFNSDGKSILVYASSCDLTISNCEFNDSDALAPVKAAIETGSDNLTAIYHNINVSNTTVNGFAVNTTNCDKVTTTLWANKNGMDQDHLNVIVDGVDVY